MSCGEAWPWNSQDNYSPIPSSLTEAQSNVVKTTTQLCFMAKSVGSSHSRERRKKRRKRERGRNSPRYPAPLSSPWAALSLVITVFEMTIAWLRFPSRDLNLVYNSEIDKTRECDGGGRCVCACVYVRARLGGRGCTTEMIHVGVWRWIRHSPVTCKLFLQNDGQQLVSVLLLAFSQKWMN